MKTLTPAFMNPHPPGVGVGTGTGVGVGVGTGVGVGVGAGAPKPTRRVAGMSRGWATFAIVSVTVWARVWERMAFATAALRVYEPRFVKTGLNVCNAALLKRTPDVGATDQAYVQPSAA